MKDEDTKKIEETIRYHTRRLLEMSRSRKEVLRRLGDSEEQRILNLMQIFLFRNKSTVHHWASELYAVCHTMDRVKGSNKYLDKDVVMDELFYSWSDSYEDWHDMLCHEVERKEKMKVPEHDHQSLYDFMQDYHDWLSNGLSKAGRVESSEVDNTIHSLLNKYPMI